MSPPWEVGIAVLLLSWIITLYTLWQMVEMHEMVPGKRFDRYHELGQHAFGEKLGIWIVAPQQLVVEVGLNIVYMVTGGQSLQKFHDVICDDKCKSKDIKLPYFIMIFASCHFVLSQLPNFHSISGVSLAAAVMSLCSYSTIAWIASVQKGKPADVHYGLRSTTTPGKVFGFFGALGDVAFAYAGHNVVLQIQATIPSMSDKPSKKPMWKGVVVAYIIVAVCYFPAALVCYWAFGNGVDENILVTLRKPKWLIALANMMVVVHLIGSYQVYAMPVFDMIETVLVRKFGFRPSLMLRLIARSVRLCRVHSVRSHHLPVLQCTAQLLWRICLHTDDVFSSLHHVAHNIQTQNFQHLMVYQLDLHCPRCFADGTVTDRWTSADHLESQDILLLPVNMINSTQNPRFVS
ncbi:lysine histidine transporter 1-like isoform X4 [Miscanthus floridulus]|uniref:lysine histidine transporter 1-like isoform X4 n=1 Tax=Miscanthus floridulus TaxID=154761 RepID=UPI003459F4E9